jgi:hypothetical protein
VDHHPDRVGLREVLLHRLGDLGGGLGPDLDELLTALVVGDDTAGVLLLDLLGVALVALEDVGLAGRRDDVLDRDRDAGAGRPAEAGLLERVERAATCTLG